MKQKNKPPELSYPLTIRLHVLQMEAYAKVNEIPPTPTARSQVHLPIRYGVHGLQPHTSNIQVSSAASLIASPDFRNGAPGNWSCDFYRHIKRFRCNSSSTSIPSASVSLAPSFGPSTSAFLTLKLSSGAVQAPTLVSFRGCTRLLLAPCRTSSKALT